MNHGGRFAAILIGVFVINFSLFSIDAWSQQTEQQIQIKSGRAKAQGCTRCHGRNGIQALAEQANWNESIGSFVTQRLTDLREGVSYHAVMTDIAAVLSDEDIRDISAWVQSLADKSE